MKYIFLLIGAGMMVFLSSSCGSSSKDSSEEVELDSNPLTALAKIGEEVQKKMETSEEKLAERRERGDTLALNYKELQKYLPESMEGYERSDPEGQSMTMQGMSYSMASVDFNNDNGDYVRITLVDYNSAYNLYSMTSTMWATGISIEDDEQKANGVKLDNGITGWEVYRKIDRESSVMLGLGYRFILTVEATNQESTEFVKSVVKSMDMDKLMEM